MQAKPYPYKQLLWLPLVIILFYIIYRIDDSRTDAYIKQFKAEYYSIRFKDSLNDKVEFIFVPKRIRSPQASFITTFDKEKFEIWAEPFGHNLTIPKVMQVGSYISKRPYDSIVTVTKIEGRDTSIYYFKLLNFKTLTYTPEKWEKPSTP